MGNTQLEEVAEEIGSRLSALGLHLEGPVGFHGHVSPDMLDDDDDETFQPMDNQAFIDNLKRDEAKAMFHMSFSINKLAWTERILHPETYVSPEMQDDMGLPTSAETMQSEVQRRMRAGEDLDDIMRDILGDEEE